MKKFLSLVLAIALAFAITAVTAFAAETTLDGSSNSTTGDVIVNINGATDLVPVYSVDVKWESLDFAYNFTSTDVWNPEDHVYDTTGGGGWSTTSATITVTNHSNVPVRALASFSGNASSLTRNDVTASISNPSFTINSAVGTNPDAAPNGSFTCSVSGVPSVTSGFTIGTITISFEPVAQ